jgi:hypothetical protein
MRNPVVQPLAALFGIVMGSSVALLAGLIMTLLVFLVLCQRPMNDRPTGVSQTRHDARSTPSTHLSGSFQEITDSGLRVVGRRVLPVAPRKGFPESNLLGQQDFFRRQVRHGLQVSVFPPRTD